LPGTLLFFVFLLLSYHARTSFALVKAILLIQLSETLNLIRAERAANKRNATRYTNLRYALRNIRAELNLA
jgi:hypothetical protein